ncbi:MAG: 3-keto-5-aminohexanoate cleavage enzyme [Paracoccaceae bacterium]|jgi:3-keto-5-aminohexanoate cleavage enzyme
MTDLCIMVAPTGARRTKADHPALPITAAEIAATATACRDAGAGAIHVHVRDGAEVHSLDADAYREAIAAIGAACPDIAIQTTTEAAGVFELPHQIASARALRPACLSFSINELMREGPRAADAFLRWAADAGVAIQFILYDADQITEFARLWRDGALHLSGAPRLILVAGRYSATQDSDVAEFETLYAALAAAGLDEAAVWMTCAFGRGELACLERTIELGGHVRVGFENAIVDATGAPARDNAERVALVADLAAKHGRAVADAAASAAILGMASLAPLV